MNAPLACPNSSDSHSSSPSTAQLTGTKTAARPLLVDRPGDQLLAGARLALDDQRERRGGHPRDLRPQLLARVGLGAEAAVVHESRPVQAARVPGGVAQLVQGRVGVGVLRRELAALGQHHPVVL